METARERIVKVLGTELSVVDEEIRGLVADKLVKALGLNGAHYVNPDEINGTVGKGVALPELAFMETQKVETAATGDEQYIDWLENMLAMLSANFMDLVKALKDSDEEALKGLRLPYSTETRKAIRLMSENAEVSNKRLEPKEIDAYTNMVIQKHPKRTQALR